FTGLLTEWRELPFTIKVGEGAIYQRHRHDIGRRQQIAGDKAVAHTALAQLQSRLQPISVTSQHLRTHTAIHILGISLNIIDQIKHLLRRIIYQSGALYYRHTLLPTYECFHQRINTTDQDNQYRYGGSITQHPIPDTAKQCGITLQLLLNDFTFHHPTDKNIQQEAPQRQEQVGGNKIDDTEERHAPEQFVL